MCKLLPAMLIALLCTGFIPVLALAQTDSMERRVERRIKRIEEKVDKVGEDMQLVIRLVVELKEARDDIRDNQKAISANSKKIHETEKSLDSVKKKMSFLFDGLGWLAGLGVVVVGTGVFFTKRKTE